MAGKRARGDGGLHFKHRPDCPKPDDSGQRPKHKCAGLWVARVELEPDSLGRRKSKEVTSRDYATAVKRLRELRRQVEDHGTVATGTMTVEKWLRQWLDEVVAVTERPTTAKSYRSIVETQLVPTLGKKRLDRLNVQHVRDMHSALRRKQTRLGKPPAESSILKAHNVLSSALTQAEREGLILRNVARIADKPELPDEDGATFTPEQVQHFLRTNQGERMAPRWAVGFFTGERQGEILGMEWERVDLETGIADVSWQLQRIPFRHGCGGDCGRKRPGSCPDRELDVKPAFTVRQLDGGLCLTRPKTKKGRRLIPLHPFLVAALRARLACGEPNPHGLVFTREDGRPVDPRVDLDEWKAALKRAGLPELGTHLARHVASQRLRAGKTDRDVMKDLMGHTKAATTSLYLERDMELASEAMLRLGDEFAIEG